MLEAWCPANGRDPHATFTMRPRFSVTIPAYNAQATLARTVASVRAQTFRDWELVIVDDGSTDDTLAVARQLAGDDDRIRVVSQENRGSGGAYNTAVREARAALLVMLSADDRLLPGHLAAFDAGIRHAPDASVFTSSGWYEYEDGRRERATPEARWVDPSGCSLEELLAACFYGVGAVYRREVFDVVGGFREGIYAEDYLFWLLALAHGFKHRHIDRPLSVHRRARQQKSANTLRMRETDLYVIAAVERSGLLSARERRAARRSAARLRGKILARQALTRLIGARALDGVTAEVRAARSTCREPGASRGAGISVAFINNFPGPSLGGGEVQLLALLRGLLSAGVKPTVVCASGSALEREARHLEGVQIISGSFSWWCLPATLRHARATLAGADVIQGTGFLTNLIARQVGARARAQVVNTVHVVPGASRLDGEGHAMTLLRTALERSSRHRVACFVAVSQAVRAGLMADNVSASKIVVIPSGVDTRALRDAAARGLGVALPVAHVRVGFVGRLERIKGCDCFLRAAATLAAARPEMRFVVAGRGSRGRELHRMAAEIGLRGRVEFLGYVAATAPVLTALDVVVVPSFSEAAGLIAAEALALQVPVVASRVGGLPEIVVDGETGLLVPPGDDAAIATAVARLLDDPELARRLAAAGAQRVSERLTVEQMVDDYLRVYGELLAQARS